MKYLLLIHTNPANWAVMSEQERNTLLGEYAAFGKEITDSGELVDGAPLGDASTATTVRVRGGQREVTDGPFIESKEHLAGYYLVDCENLDRAIALAERIPDARFSGVEVRPVMDMGGVEL
jgi:hypothetical protein